ncbi:MAG: O-antigen ligase family protein [Acidobacteriota bacterium]
MKYRVAGGKTKVRRSWPLLPWLAGVFLTLLPFVVSIDGFFKFRAPKDVFAALAVLLLASVWVLTRPRMRPELGTWELLVGAALLFAGLHSLFSHRPEVTMPAFVQILLFATLGLILTQVATERFQKVVWLSIGLATSVNAVITVLQYLGKFPLMERPGGETLSGRLTPAGFIGEVNSGGFLFALVCLLSLHGILAERKPAVRLVCTGIFFLNLAGLAFTRSLTALFGLLICLALWLPFHHWWVYRKGRKLARELLIFWVILASGLTAGAVVAVQAGMVDRVVAVARQFASGDWTVATSGRRPVYLITWKMIQDRPLSGHGLNTFGQDFYQYRSDTEYGQSLALLNQPGAFREVHNEFLQVWEEMGLGGLLLFLALILVPPIKAFKLVVGSEDALRAYWVAMLSFGLLFAAVSSLTFFPFHQTVTVVYILLLLASLRSFSKKTPRANPATRTPTQLPPSSGWRLPRLVLVGAVLLIASFGAYVQVAKWSANREMGFAELLLEKAQSPQLKGRLSRAFADQAWARLQRAERLYPRFHEIYNLEGSAAMLLGRHEQAKALYKRAAHFLPSPEVYTNLASAHLASGDLGEARSYVERALRYNPEYDRARKALRYLKKAGP